MFTVTVCPYIQSVCPFGGMVLIVVVVVSCGWMPVPLSESTGWVAVEVEPKVNVPLRLPRAPGVKLAVSDTPKPALGK